MKNITAIAKNEQGSVLVMAILILVLLTILAFTAMRTSTIERQIAGNELLHQKYFFSADAGVDHAVKLLEQPFVAINAPLGRSGSTASWDFAFLGADRVVSPEADVLQEHRGHTGESEHEEGEDQDGFGSRAHFLPPIGIHFWPSTRYDVSGCRSCTPYLYLSASHVPRGGRL